MYSIVYIATFSNLFPYIKEEIIENIEYEQRDQYVWKISLQYRHPERSGYVHKLKLITDI